MSVTGTEGRTLGITLEVQGMRCDHCAKTVGDTLRALRGVEEVQVERAEGRVRILSRQALDPASLKEILSAKGYTLIATHPSDAL